MVNHFEKAETRMRINATNLRIFESKYLNIWISVPTNTRTLNLRVNCDARSSLGKRESKYKKT